MIKNYTRGIQHIGIPTNQLAASEAFYKICGFQEINRERQPDGGEVVFMESQQLVIELWTLEAMQASVGAIDHLAIDVDQIQKVYEIAEKKGLKIISNGIEKLPYWKKGIEYFIVEGPNREKIEFCQINL